tara:strand:+ start:347 stop:604 length:258 start_codon:yes stop_codon:yes gene_type:complete
MTDSNISLPQAAVLASEVSLAKNYAIKANSLLNTTVSDVNNLRNEVYANDSSLNIVISKLENLCNLLIQADISGVNDASFNYTNL